MRIKHNHTTAICIDIQDRLFPHIFEHSELEANCIKLITGLKLLQVPIIVTQQYTKGLGKTIPSIASALGEYDPQEKMAFSACELADVEGAILGPHGHHMIVFGVETHVCIQQTVLDVLGQGRVPVVVEDCVSSRKQRDRDTAINRMREHGAVITSYEALLFEIMERADHDVFKQISQLVK